MEALARDFTPDIPSHSQRIKQFFLARQPILNRQQNLFAYELLFRRAPQGEAAVTDDLAATASVIAHTSELGMTDVLGPYLGFINVDAAALMSDFIDFLPKDKVVLEILETVDATGELIQRVQKLKDAGFRFALDDVIDQAGCVGKLLRWADIIKVDIQGMEQGQLARLSAHFLREGKQLLAEKVETREQYEQCLALGFHYFQGYYFARPTILSGTKLTPSQTAIMQLMAQFASQADAAEIEQSIKQDASLGLTLLRLANATMNGGGRIDTIGRALDVFGHQQMQRWVQILLYAEPARSGGVISPLLTMATTRGRLLELMADKRWPGERSRADAAFTVGVMSLMDALFAMPMCDILARLSVAEEVRKALLARDGVYGDMLKLVEWLEQLQASDSDIGPLMTQLQLSTEDLYALQLAAFQWSDRIASSTGEPHYDSQACVTR